MKLEPKFIVKLVKESLERNYLIIKEIISIKNLSMNLKVRGSNEY